MVSIRADVTGCAAKTLVELTKLIEKRQTWFGESAKDAVVATAIDAMLSIRAATASAKKRRATKPKIVDVPGLVAGFTGGRSPKRALRLSGGGGRFASRRVKWLTRGVASRDAKVFAVRPEHDSVKEYYVVARSVAEAKRFENAAAIRRMRRYGNLAKWAFGVAMNKISTRGVKDDLTGEARLAGSRLSKVSAASSGGAYSVMVDDSVAYAASALRGGKSAVDVAVKKAANKIAGRLLHRFGDALGPDFKTPFPEVKRRAK